MKKVIGKRIKEIRLDNKLSQAEFGALFFVSQDTVSLWELNKRTPIIDDIVKLANLFNLSIEEMISIEKDANDKYIL